MEDGCVLRESVKGFQCALKAKRVAVEAVRVLRFLVCDNSATRQERLSQATAVSCLIELVGTTGFEPATSRTPSVRATRLRHVPMTVLVSRLRINCQTRVTALCSSFLFRGDSVVRGVRRLTVSIPGALQQSLQRRRSVQSSAVLQTRQPQ